MRLHLVIENAWTGMVLHSTRRIRCLCEAFDGVVMHVGACMSRCSSGRSDDYLGH